MQTQRDADLLRQALTFNTPQDVLRGLITHIDHDEKVRDENSTHYRANWDKAEEGKRAEWKRAETAEGRCWLLFWIAAIGWVCFIGAMLNILRH